MKNNYFGITICWLLLSVVTFIRGLNQNNTILRVAYILMSIGFILSSVVMIKGLKQKKRKNDS
jgi:hypothetical protein